MCITSAPAHLSNTTVAAWFGERRGKIFHGLAYQNTAQNLVNSRMSSEFPGNAMIFAFPALSQTVGPANFLDLGKSKALDDMVRAAIPPEPVMRSMSLGGNPKGAVQFFQVGIYSVFLTERPGLIPAAIRSRVKDGSLPLERAPRVSHELMAFYAAQYPGWPLAVFCFETREAQRSEPVFLVYEPRFLDHLYAPAVDSHHGGPPDLGEMVDVDHQVVFGVQNLSHWPVEDRQGLVTYTDSPDILTERMRSLLPNAVLGDKFHGVMPNGDFAISLNSLQYGEARIQRVEPAFWRRLQPA